MFERERRSSDKPLTRKRALLLYGFLCLASLVTIAFHLWQHSRPEAILGPFLGLLFGLSWLRTTLRSGSPTGTTSVSRFWVAMLVIFAGGFATGFLRDISRVLAEH
jgi:glucose dehydrogenase